MTIVPDIELDRKRETSWRLWLLGGAGVAALLLLPMAVYPLLLMKIMCFALFAAAFNLLFGFTGLLSFGHAAFFGVAAYGVAHALKEWGIGPGTGLIFGVALASMLGLAIGALAIRRQGVYFSMITLALSQLVYFIILQAPFARGEDGLQAVPRGQFLGLIALSDPTNLYIFVSLLFVASLAAIWRIVNSPFGRIMHAIKENEARAMSMGYDVSRYKLTMFVLSAAFTGLAGGMKVLVFQFATLNDVTWQASGEPILMTLIGGIGTMAGPVVGAAIVVVAQNYLATSPLPVTLVTGLIFIFCVLLFRRGIVGEFSNSATVRRWAARFNGRTPE